MAKARTLVGLDVRAAKIVAAVLDADTGELKVFAMQGDVVAAAGFCAGLPRPVRVAYEAGPTGVHTRARAREAARGVRGRGAVEDPARDRREGQDRSV
jgi:hypothetical protein